MSHSNHIGDWQGKGGGMKAATSVNVRHILCEKQSKALEALQKIQVRATFASIASELYALNSYALAGGPAIR